jgi:hypothetical protein
MSEDAEKYHYFKVGLLKDSYALEALWQDALRYHMINQPAQLIALRLTEYYELMRKDPAQSTANTAMTLTELSERENMEEIETPISSSPAASSLAPLLVHLPEALPATPAPSATTSTTTDQVNGLHANGEASLTVSAGVDQNAEDAADYWSLL